MDREYHNGQEMPVLVLRLIAENTPLRPPSSGCSRARQDLACGTL